MTWNELLIQIEELDPNEQEEQITVEIDEEKFRIKELVFKKRTAILIAE